jgi:hypothetical protein
VARGTTTLGAEAPLPVRRGGLTGLAHQGNLYPLLLAWVCLFVNHDEQFLSLERVHMIRAEKSSPRRKQT